MEFFFFSQSYFNCTAKDWKTWKRDFLFLRDVLRAFSFRFISASSSLKRWKSFKGTKMIFNIIYFPFKSNYFEFLVEITLPGNIPSSVRRRENTPTVLNWLVQKPANNMSVYPLATENRSLCFIKMPSFSAGIKGNVSCLWSPVKVLLLR